jgi:hypothetical protein
MQVSTRAWSGALLLAAVLAFTPLASNAQDALTVAEVRLGKGVQDRQITEEATAFAVNEKAYLWMRVTGGSGQSIKVEWRNADFTDVVTLNIGGSPWRTWSSKTLAKTGDWKVTVTDAGGEVLSETAFQVE